MVAKSISQWAGAFLLALLSQSYAQNQWAVAGTPVPLEPDLHGWYQLFDGKTLSGWGSYDISAWSARDGEIVGDGGVSHLFSPDTYRNVEFKAEVKLNHRGNSGMYFRTRLGPGFPRGYEAQVENTSPDPQRTGSLYNFAKVTEQLIPDDTWWTQHIIAIGNRIIIKVNGQVVVDYIDRKNTHTLGHLALQQHNRGSVVHFRNLMVKPLPNDEAAALEEARKDIPEIK